MTDFLQHKYRDKLHPTKSQKLARWSAARKRWYHYTFKYAWCKRCKNWAWGVGIMCKGKP